MKIEQANFIKDALEFVGEEASIREDYSGRGMFGKTTVGVVVDNQSRILPAVLTFIKENELTHDEIPDFDGPFNSDNMARDIILY